jgi:aspartate-semialdehyde dehydrogenase
VTGNRALRVSVVGATGVIGREIASLLFEREFPLGELRLYGSELDEGEEIEVAGEPRRVDRLPRELPEVDVAFLCATAEVSGDIADELADAGGLVIDLASGSEAAPLVLGAREAEAAERTPRGGLIVRLADPLTRLIAVPLRALAPVGRVERAIATAVVSASAFGKAAIDRLSAETISLLTFQERDEAPEPGEESEESEESEDGEENVAFRCIPEDPAAPMVARVTAELGKLLDGSLPVAVSVVRAPFFFGHAAALSIELDRPVALEEIRAALRDAPSLVVGDGIPSPFSTFDAIGADGIYVVGLVRREDDPKWVHFWAVADNIRQGAAMAAVSLAEALAVKH